MSQLSDLLFETRVAAESVVDFLAGGRLRLGVTGLSRSGKTVFITALVHHLTRAIAGGPEGRREQHQLPVFRALAEGRITSAPISIRSRTTRPALRLRGASRGADRRQTGIGRNRRGASPNCG